MREHQKRYDDSLIQQIVAYFTLRECLYRVQHGGPSSSAVFDLLADEYARKILVAADRGPKTAKALSEECDASLTTIYRRISRLQEHDLLEERHTVDADGAHRSEFETALEELHVDLTDGDFSLTLETRDELADNFTSLWDGLRGED